MKRDIISGAMRNHFLVFFFLVAIVAFGFYALPRMNKNEFPEVTIRVGVVAVVYPGATAEEIEQQCSKQVENYLFTFRDVNKKKTYSYARDGMLYVYVTLVDDVKDAPMTWSRIRQGLQLFRLTNLPQGVVATAVVDDFGDASSVLLVMESDERSPRELSYFMDLLSDRLRTIPEMGNLKIVGDQNEEVAIYMDPARLTQYAISPSMVSTELAAQGIRTLSGQFSNAEGEAVVRVAIPFTSLYDIANMVIFGDPLTKQTVRLRDVAELEYHYPYDSPYVLYEDTVVRDNDALVLSLTMRPGNNVVAFGKHVDEQIADFMKVCPPDIRMHRVTDQPVTVGKSVRSFMKDLVEAVLVVIFVMLILFPLRTALVSSTSVPVCIAATFAIMFMLGIELNTVTLAALIVVLGMIVDDSVVVIDGYTDMLNEGHSAWYSAAVSTKALMGSMLIATCSISGMFFPMLRLMRGCSMGDFIRLFPWAIFIALSCSFLYAIWVIPYMSARMIRRQKKVRMSFIEQAQSKFFLWLQGGYSRLLTACFAHKYTTVFVAFLTVVAGGLLFTQLNVQMLPKAERDSFAVEIHLASGNPLQATEQITDSLSGLLEQDPRVVSITSFVGMSSPRFHITYAPQLASNHFAQFIVNTVSENATKEMINDLQVKYENYFPNAHIRFKQMDYQAVAAPIELHLMGDSYADLEPIRDSVVCFLKRNPHLAFVHSDFDDTENIIDVVLNTDEANRMGITQSTLSLYLSGALRGSQMASVWDDDYSIPIKIYTSHLDSMTYQELGDLLIPSAKPGEWVPLSQIATIKPAFHYAQMPHRNGRRSITVSADVLNGYGQMREFHKLLRYVETLPVPNGVTIEPGGAIGITREAMGPLMKSVLGAILVMFLVLVIHYGKIGISTLAIVQSLLCLFGAAFGLWIFGADFSITAILGLISLIGIIVRNGIIMYDHALELQAKEHMSPSKAAFEAGLRRMRPIFLTSATTALGVVPMIVAKTMLWMPMGIVICFGTLLTLPLVITVLPVTYCLVFDRNARQNHRLRILDRNFHQALEAHEGRIEKFNRKKGLTVLLLFLALPLSGRAEVLTLDSCRNLALRNNTSIESARLDIEAADYVRRSVLAKFFPQVNISAFAFYGLKPLIQVNIGDMLDNIQTDDVFSELIKEIRDELRAEGSDPELHLMQRGYNVGAMAVQPITAGGRIANGYRLSKVGVAAAEKKAEVAERDILQQVEDTYWLIAGLQEKRKTVAAATALLDTAEYVAKHAFDAGLVTRNDLMKVQIKRNELMSKKLQLENGLHLASGLLYTLLNVPFDGEPKLEQLPDDSEVDAFILVDTFSVSGRPEAELLQMNIEAEKLRKKMTVGEACPVVAVGASTGVSNLFDKNRVNAIGFVTVTIPLTMWGEQAYKIKEHNIRIRQAELMQKDLSRKMQLQNEQAYDELTQSIQLMLQFEKSHSLAEDNYRLALLNYEAGLTTITDLLESQMLLMQAENDHTDARIQYRSALRRFNSLNK